MIEETGDKTAGELEENKAILLLEETLARIQGVLLWASESERKHIDTDQKMRGMHERINTLEDRVQRLEER